MEIKITKEKILEAAARCSTAKETLKVLFPEVFSEAEEFDENKIYGYTGVSGCKYKLHRAMNDKFSWADAEKSIGHASGQHNTAESCIQYAKEKGTLKIFVSTEEFAKWLLE